MKKLTYVDYETGHEYSMANIFMQWGAKGYKEAFPIEDADMKMLLTSGDIEFDFWDDENITICYEELCKMQKGDTKLFSLSDGQMLTLVREE